MDHASFTPEPGVLVDFVWFTPILVPAVTELKNVVYRWKTRWIGSDSDNGANVGRSCYGNAQHVLVV